MKPDYKLPLKRTGRLPNRLVIRFALGFVAVFCLSLAFYHKKPPTPVPELAANTETTALTLAQAAPDLPKVTHLENREILSNPTIRIPNEKIVSEKVVEAKPTPSAFSLTQSPSNLAPDEQLVKITDTQNTSLGLDSSEDHWRLVTVKPGDTLAKIFKRYGYPKKDLQEILDANPKHQKQLTALKANQTLRLLLSPEKNRVNGLTLDLECGRTLKLSKNAAEFQINEGLLNKEQPIEKQLAFGKGTIRDSLFSAGKKAGLDHNVISQMVDIFGWNIDFTSDLRPNDSFRVLFEEKRLDGERIGSGPILAAEIMNHGKKHQAIRYTDKSGRTGYFSPDGSGMHQAFLRYPLNFTRISSAFGKRHHPISHKMRHHKGIDYSAPSGTPVQATGDAKVIFAGTRGGYGRVIELQHGARYSTLYAHLSRFAKNLKIGSEVKQGQVIGYVGRTGLATGDHLHYEFRVDGIHRDPLTIEVPRRNLIPDSHKRHFLAHAKEMLRLMDLHENKISTALNDYPKNE